MLAVHKFFASKLNWWEFVAFTSSERNSMYTLAPFGCQISYAILYETYMELRCVNLRLWYVNGASTWHDCNITRRESKENRNQHILGVLSSRGICLPFYLHTWANQTRISNRKLSCFEAKSQFGSTVYMSCILSWTLLPIRVMPWLLTCMGVNWNGSNLRLPLNLNLLLAVIHMYMLAPLTENLEFLLEKYNGIHRWSSENQKQHFLRNYLSHIRNIYSWKDTYNTCSISFRCFAATSALAVPCVHAKRNNHQPDPVLKSLILNFRRFFFTWIVCIEEFY